MASFDEIVSKMTAAIKGVREAVLGKDVREFIASGYESVLDAYKQLKTAVDSAANSLSDLKNTPIYPEKCSFIDTNIFWRENEVKITDDSTYSFYSVYFEDFEVGKEYVVRCDKVINAKDNIIFDFRTLDAQGDAIEIQTGNKTGLQTAVTPTSNTVKMLLRLCGSYGTSLNNETAIFENVRIFSHTIGTEKKEKYNLNESIKVNTKNLDNDIFEMHKLDVSKCVRSVGHKGGNAIDYPQDSKLAVINGKKLGIDVSENDVHGTKDGKYVMYHDDTFYALDYLKDIKGYDIYFNASGHEYFVKSNIVYEFDYVYAQYHESNIALSSLTRANGSNYSPESLSYRLLKRIDVGIATNQNFAGLQIMSFEEWVVLCKQLGLEMQIHLKTDFTEENVKEIVNIVKYYDMLPYSYWNCRKKNFPIVRSIDARSKLIIDWYPDDSLIDECKPYLLSDVKDSVMFSVDVNEMTVERVREAKNNGYSVGVWYATEEAQTNESLNTMYTYGVSEIVLNKLSLKQWVNKELLS